MADISTLEVNQLTVGYHHKPIVKDVSVTLPQNKISVIIGANGCGKSTFLKSMARLLTPDAGMILLDGREIQKENSKLVARKLGLLPQSPTTPDGIKVSDLITRGRFPYRKFMQNLSSEDYRAVEEAMHIMGVQDLADKSVDELSGGQRQRVWIALALAQETDILLLDEPITYLDISYQIEILDLLVDLNQKRGTTICMVLHDINLAAKYADYIFAMKKGQLIKEGKPSEVISSELLEEVFGLKSTIINDPVSNTPLIIPIGRHKIRGAF
jgi:iron complex transport system ATP-binding protein